MIRTSGGPVALLGACVLAVPLVSSGHARSTAASAYQATVLADTPLAYHRLDDGVGSSTASDASGNGRTAAVTGGVVFGAPGALSEENAAATIAANTSPASAYLASPAHAGSVVSLTGAWTLEAWARPGATGSRALISWRDPSGRSTRIIQTSGGEWQGMQHDGTTTRGVIAVGSTSAARWDHLVFTSDGTTLRFYVNAELAGTTAAINPGVATGTPLRIGGDNSSGWVGGIDEVAVYGRELDARRIHAHFVARSSSTPAPPQSDEASPGAPPQASVDPSPRPCSPHSAGARLRTGSLAVGRNGAFRPARTVRSTYGARESIKGTLLDASGKGLTGEAIVIGPTSGDEIASVATARTGKGGTFTLRAPVREPGILALGVRNAEGRACTPLASLNVVVRRRVLLARDFGRAVGGGRYEFRGRVEPSVSRIGRSTVVVETLFRGRWIAVGRSARVRPDGSFLLRLRKGLPGRQQLRVVALASGKDRFQSGVSTPRWID